MNFKLDPRVNKEELIKTYQDKVKKINKAINEKTLPGNDFLGWVDLPINYDKNEFEQIKKDAQYVRNNYDVLLVCGIGGSYLGARSALEALKGLKNNDKIEILFVGNTFSSDYIYQILEYVKNKKFAINVISKSGTTTETSISFRLFKELLESKVGKENAKNAIFATTDKEKGALKTLATKEGYQTYVLPDDVGGRYSVLTAVGLFPLAVAGVNIDELMLGAKQAREMYNNEDLANNECYLYACSRDYQYRHNKSVEMYVFYDLQYTQLSEWLKQLFGESEGKDHKGLYPSSATFTTDLHSLGQFIQEGTPLLFETVTYVNKPKNEVIIPHDEENLDGLNYLENKSLSFVNNKAFEGTLKAHRDGGVIVNVIELEEMDERNLGHLLYFFMRACAMSAYLLEINPFNQPGVEIYKKNMFHLLGKKGY